MKRRTRLRWVSVFVVICLCLCVVPTVALPVCEVDEIIPQSVSNLPDVSSLQKVEFIREAKDEITLREELGQLTFEIVSMRQENVKHFRLEDGTYQAVIYGVPVHRLTSDGKWEEINNSLSEIEGAISTNNARVKFAKKITGNENLFTLHENNYKIAFGLKGAVKKVPGIVGSPQKALDDNATKLQKPIILDNLTSSIVYENIFDGVDLEYILVSNSVKENIIIKEIADSYSYTFSLSLNGLDAEMEGEEIILYDSSTHETIYKIPAPYMYDSANEYSYDAHYTLIDMGNGKYEYTLIADEEWINSKDRIFPIVVDPSLVDLGQIADTYVNSQSPNINYGAESRVWVSDSQQGLYKFTTPTLPDGTNITSASVKIPYFDSVTNNKYISVAIYSLMGSWTELSATWNTRPTLGSSCLDVLDIGAYGATEANPQYATFSVTDYVKSWYLGSSNNGFALKREGGTNNSIVFVSREKMSAFAQLTINYTGTHMPDGVYAIQKNLTTYFKTYIPDGLAWVLQDTSSYTSPPVSSSNLENLFKISYRPTYDDYVIRSMLDSSLVVFPSIANNAPIVGKKSTNDNAISTDHTWKIVYTQGYYYIQHTASNGITYYIRSVSTTNDDIIELTTNANDSGTKWAFNKYTGKVIEDVEFMEFFSSIDLGETYQYQAYMYSSRIGHNGPVTYTVADTDGTSTNRATINANTGVLTAHSYGKIQIRTTYAGAPWIWIWYVSIGGTFVDEVPLNLTSNSTHYCIPCAITNIAAFWCINEGYTQFACADPSSQETRAIEVQNAMINHGGCHVNANIPSGFDIFSHTEGGITYGFDVTICWRSDNAFDWDTIVNEIDAGRPLMLGFDSTDDSPYNDVAHMTVCVGYNVSDGVKYVYVSDAHNNNQYIRHAFSIETYNDFVGLVRITEE